MRKRLFLGGLLALLVFAVAGFLPAPQQYPAYQIRTGSALPAACNPGSGDVFILAPAYDLYACTAANTWTKIINNAGPAVFTVTGAEAVATLTRTDAGEVQITITGTTGSSDYGVGAGGTPFINVPAAGELAYRVGNVGMMALDQYGGIRQTGLLFAALPAAANGTIIYCGDCTFANPCAGGGTGALAKRLNGAWRCD